MNRSIMTDNILLQKIVSDLTYMHWSFSELECFYDHQKFIKAYPLGYNMYSYFMNLKKKQSNQSKTSKKDLLGKVLFFFIKQE